MVQTELGCPDGPRQASRAGFSCLGPRFSVEKEKACYRRAHPSSSNPAHSPCLARRSRPSPAHDLWRSWPVSRATEGFEPFCRSRSAHEVEHARLSHRGPRTGQNFARPPAPSVTPFCQGNFHRKKWSGPVSNQAERLPTGPDRFPQVAASLRSLRRRAAAAPPFQPRSAITQTPRPKHRSDPDAPSPPCQVAGLTARKGTAAMVCVLAGMTLVGFPARVSC